MNVKKVLYEKVVVPTVMYGLESWGMKGRKDSKSWHKVESAWRPSSRELHIIRRPCDSFNSLAEGVVQTGDKEYSLSSPHGQPAHQGGQLSQGVPESQKPA